MINGFVCSAHDLYFIFFCFLNWHLWQQWTWKTHSLLIIRQSTRNSRRKISIFFNVSRRKKYATQMNNEPASIPAYRHFSFILYLMVFRYCHWHIHSSNVHSIIVNKCEIRRHHLHRRRRCNNNSNNNNHSRESNWTEIFYFMILNKTKNKYACWKRRSVCLLWNKSWLSICS